MAAALAFVGRVDAREFRTAWETASYVLRSSTSFPDYERAMQFAATVRGPVVKRKALFWMYPARPGERGEGTVITIRFATVSVDRAPAPHASRAERLSRPRACRREASDLCAQLRPLD